jgi:hypothetical protein
MPKLLDIDEGADAAYFYSQGGGETLIAGISDYNDNSGAQRQIDSWKNRRVRDPWAA